MEPQRTEPFVSAETKMPEATPRAVLLGVVMAMFMGAANAYLGLKAGMTIAATYTTAVIGMAVIKSLKGSILEENCARTVGSIGGNIATGAIFTLPAFFIAGIWPEFATTGHYLQSSAIMLAGLYADGETSVREPTLSRDHSERMFRLFGASVQVFNSGVTVRISVSATGNLGEATSTVGHSIISANSPK